MRFPGKCQRGVGLIVLLVPPLPLSLCRKFSKRGPFPWGQKQA